MAAFFGVGVGKALVVARIWWRSGFETVAVGGTEAALAYAAGVGLGGVVLSGGHDQGGHDDRL